MYLRSIADFDNYRRRWKKTLLVPSTGGNAASFSRFMEIVDSFDRALLQVGNAAAPLVEGLQAIHRKDAGIARIARRYPL